jgi:hypothetical protein
MGLDIVLGWDGQTEDERSELMSRSESAGDQVGYLRFDYSEFNFFHWARANLGGRDPCWIFDYSDDKLRTVDAAESGEGLKAFFPDWNLCRERIEEALSLAKRIDNDLIAVPLRKPSGDPTKFPDDVTVLDIYRDEREELAAFWSGHKEPGIPLPTRNGRFATDSVKIEAVMWCQYMHYRQGALSTLDIRPVLICQSPPGFRQACISTLEWVKRFIEFGREKNGWMYWSG